MLRSDLWPVWIGLPLGAWDDLASGQPIGSAMALWTIVMLAMDALDRRLVWRDHWIDWVVGGTALLFVLIVGALLAHAGSLADAIVLVGPQFLWSLFLLPAAMLIVARLDRWRLTR
jgi:rod shape-determining protein MreD